MRLVLRNFKIVAVHMKRIKNFGSYIVDAVNVVTVCCLRLVLITRGRQKLGPCSLVHRPELPAEFNHQLQFAIVVKHARNLKDFVSSIGKPSYQSP
jgi:hypothetical protein